MEKITDFFKEIQNRLTNPLISSFIIAWLITNWRIPIGLLAYSNSDLDDDGYTSYFDLISTESSWSHFLVIPLISAVSYTLIFPIIRTLIIAFLSFIRQWSENWNHKILKDLRVPMAAFLKEKAKYTILSEKLTEVYNQDSATVEENNKLKADILKLNNEISTANLEKDQNTQSVNILKKEINDFHKWLDPSLLNGYWEFKRYSGKKDIVVFNQDTAFTIFISNKTIYKIAQAKILVHEEILGFKFDGGDVELTLKSHYITNQNPMLGYSNNMTFQRLLAVTNSKEDIIEMKGTDAADYKIEYIKIDPSESLQTLVMSTIN